MKQVAVIILNWNGLNLLKQFLPAAVKHTVSDKADLFVADNGSSDGSVEWVEANFPQVKLLRFPENLGFAGGYNRAIELTDYPLTLLLNSDVEVTPHWLVPLLDYMDANPDCGALQPKIRWQRNPRLFEYAGAAGGLIDKNGYPYCRGRLFDSLETDHGQYDRSPADIAWASGAALLVRSNVYKAVGGLDIDFFAHMEEIDLCCRIHAAGFRVVCVPASTVFHVGGASLAQGNPRKTYLNFRNNLLLLHKNLPRAIGRRRLFIRRLYDTLAWAMFILKADFPNAAAVLKAHRDFRRMKRKYSTFPAADTLRSLPGASHNIIVDRYLRRKKVIENV